MSNNITSSQAYELFYLTAHTICKGLLLLWMFNSSDFNISFLVKDMPRNVWNRLFGSFMVDMGILLSNMKFHFLKYNMTF